MSYRRLRDDYLRNFPSSINEDETSSARLFLHRSRDRVRRPCLTGSDGGHNTPPPRGPLVEEATRPQEYVTGIKNGSQKNGKRQRKKKSGILCPNASNKSFRVEVRPSGWSTDKIWRGRIHTKEIAQRIADAVFHYTGTEPVHFEYPNGGYFPPFLNKSLQSLTTRQACLMYVKSIAKGRENFGKRREFIESVKEMVEVLAIKHEAYEVGRTLEELPTPTRNNAEVLELPNLNHNDGHESSGPTDDKHESHALRTSWTPAPAEGVTDHSRRSSSEDLKFASAEGASRKVHYIPSFSLCHDDENTRFDLRSVEDTPFESLGLLEMFSDFWTN